MLIFNLFSVRTVVDELASLLVYSDFEVEKVRHCRNPFDEGIRVDYVVKVLEEDTTEVGLRVVSLHWVVE